MVHVHDVQVDVPPGIYDEVVAFWAAALGAVPEPVVPGRFTHLTGAAGAVGLHLQRLDDGPGGMHLDLATPDPAGEADRLVALGAEPVGDLGSGRVLRDPAGLPFCLVRGLADDGLTGPRDGRGYLKSVFVDVPDALVARELAFWSAALGGAVEPTEEPDTYTAVAGLAGPGGPLVFEVQRIAAGDRPRHHVDVAAADVAAEAARLRSLGATHEADVENWVVLRDPAGNPFCVVPARGASPVSGGSADVAS